MNGKPNIVFFGTPEFAKIVLERMTKAGYKPKLVVTAPDRPVGRKQITTPPPVKVAAQKYQIPVLQPATLTISNFEFLISRQFQNKNFKIKEWQPDLFIVAAYGKIIKKEILDIPKHGTLNVHPSLLPKLRGASPIQYAILEGHQKTGVTIMLVDEEMDHGPILASQEFSISNYQFSKDKGKPTAEELHDILVKMGGELLVEILPQWLAGKIEPQEQKHELATYTKILTREDGHITWTKTAEEIERMIRAFTPWPGTFALWNKKRLKILEAEANTEFNVRDAAEGQVALANSRPVVQTGKGVLLPIKLQLEGGRPAEAIEFLRGHNDFAGALLV